MRPFPDSEPPPSKKGTGWNTFGREIRLPGLGFVSSELISIKSGPVLQRFSRFLYCNLYKSELYFAYRWRKLSQKRTSAKFTVGSACVWNLPIFQNFRSNNHNFFAELDFAPASGSSRTPRTLPVRAACSRKSGARKNPAWCGCWRDREVPREFSGSHRKSAHGWRSCAAGCGCGRPLQFPPPSGTF